jgi:hypothetical protein
VHRTSTPTVLQPPLSVDALAADLLRRRPKIQRKRGKVSFGSDDFKGVKWTLHVEPIAGLAVLRKNWRQWSTGIQRDIAAVMKGRAKPMQHTLPFLSHRMNVVYRFLKQRAANDDHLVAVVRPFLTEDPTTTKARCAWVPAAAGIVRAAYPDEWEAAKLPEPRAITRYVSFLNQHIGRVGTPLTRRDCVLAAATINRAWPRSCPRCRATVAPDEISDHLEGCAPDLVRPQVHDVRRHWTRREEAERRRLLRMPR